MAGESAHASHPGARAAIPRAPFAFVRVRCGECRVSLSLVSVSEWSYFCTFSSFPALRRRLPHLLSHRGVAFPAQPQRSPGTLMISADLVYFPSKLEDAPLSLWGHMNYD